MNDVELLKQVPLFSQMDDSELSGLRSIMERVQYSPGQGLSFVPWMSRPRNEPPPA